MSDKHRLDEVPEPMRTELVRLINSVASHPHTRANEDALRELARAWNEVARKELCREHYERCAAEHVDLHGHDPSLAVMVARMTDEQKAQSRTNLRACVAELRATLQKVSTDDRCSDAHRGEEFDPN